jgi:tetratricopeptide (TPR) repeat protein
MRKLAFLLLAFFSLSAHAQIQKGAFVLANEYFAQGNYAQALSYYLELYPKNPQLETIERIKICYIKTESYDDGLKFLKKASKQFKSNPFPVLWQGEILAILNKPEEALKLYQKGTDISFGSYETDPEKVAAFFIGMQEYPLAFDIYNKLRKQYKDPLAYTDEICIIYRQLGDKKGLFNEVLNVLNINSHETANVKQKLYNDLTEKEDFDVLQGILVDKINAQPDNAAFADVLIWMLVQQNKFQEALVQAKALDKRFNAKGQKLFELANYAFENYQLQQTMAALNMVLDYGESSRYYFPAYAKLLEVYYEAFESHEQIDTTLALQRYQEYLSSSNNYSTFETLLNYIKIMVYHTKASSEARSYLKNYRSSHRLSAQQDAQLKLIEADALVFLGETYEALLLCGQVELDFKDNPIGQEAKFKSAKINYYNGDFNWSKAQLDVLKASTTQLYANDALNLSLLISENTGSDSLQLALNYFAKADLLLLQNRIPEAYTLFDSIQAQFPGDELSDDILMLKGKKLLEMNKLEEAAGFFEQIVQSYNYDIWADDALFALAEIASKKGDNAKSLELYEQLIREYPSSLFVIPARSQYAKLKSQL